eukprot:scaffold310972_cov32-Tisochrysis_lutea.AAC.2
MATFHWRAIEVGTPEPGCREAAVTPEEPNLASIDLAMHTIAYDGPAEGGCRQGRRVMNRCNWARTCQS